MKAPHTCESLCNDLQRLGLEKGDTVFVHSSFKSIGPVEGGAETVVRAFEKAVGVEGLILMPSFNLVEGPKRAETWDIETTPSTVGWLTEFFRCMPGTVRSDHYSHSVAARGKGAREHVAEHLSKEGLQSPWDREPWGKTYGRRSPMYKAYTSGGKLLMLGVDYETSTYTHLVEVRLWNRRLQNDSSAKYISLSRPALGAFWDRNGSLQQGLLGDACCRLFNIAAYVDTLSAEIDRNLHLYQQT